MGKYCLLKAGENEYLVYIPPGVDIESIHKSWMSSRLRDKSMKAFLATHKGLHILSQLEPVILEFDS